MPKKLIKLILLTACSIVALSGCQRVLWEEYISEEGNFQVFAPDKPDIEEVIVDTNQKQTGKGKKYLFIHSSHGVYAVEYTDWPPGVPILVDFESNVDGFIENQTIEKHNEEKIEEKKEILLEGKYYGKEYMLSGYNLDMGNYTQLTRIYLVGKRSYFISALVYRNGTIEQARKFLDSFALLQK